MTKKKKKTAVATPRRNATCSRVWRDGKLAPLEDRGFRNYLKQTSPGTALAKYLRVCAQLEALPLLSRDYMLEVVLPTGGWAEVLQVMAREAELKAGEAQVVKYSGKAPAAPVDWSTAAYGDYLSEVDRLLDSAGLASTTEEEMAGVAEAPEGSETPVECAHAIAAARPLPGFPTK